MGQILVAMTGFNGAMRDEFRRLARQMEHLPATLVIDMLVMESGRPDMSQLSGKKAIVTGGSRGIGAGIVRTLAEDGADVGFTYISHDDAANDVVGALQAMGRNGLGVKADSSEPQELTDAVNHLAHQLGGLDIFVSSAGALMFKPVEEFGVDDFDEIVALDLRAAFVGSKAALTHMKKGGRIVFISSNIADYAALPTTGFYSMVKSGLDGLCKGMARDSDPRA
jgi:3-oxoacyl-[acyl-carrier protein] reductase